MMKSTKGKGVPMTFEQLWQVRFQRLLREWLKYGRLVVSDHLALVSVIVVGFGGLYYRQLLTQLDTWTPNMVRMLISVVLWLIWWSFLRLGKPILLVHASDSSYILPRLPQWRKLWLVGASLAAIVPFMVMSLLTGIFIPLVWRYFEDGSAMFIGLWLGLLLIKLSLSVHFLNRASGHKGIFISSDWLAVMASSLFAYGLWLPVAVRISIWGSVVCAILVYVGLCYHRLIQQPLNIEAFVVLEEERQAAFYKWVSIFADVPQLKPPVKRRAYLDRLLHKLPGGDTPVGYYAMRLLWRDTAYSGIAWRVFCFTVMLLLGMEAPYFLIIAGMLSSLLTVIQYVPLYRVTQQSPFMTLYPLMQEFQGIKRHPSFKAHQRRSLRSFQLVVLMMLLAQWLGYVVVLLMKGSLSLSQLVVILVSWWGMIALLIMIYLPWKCAQNKLKRNVM